MQLLTKKCSFQFFTPSEILSNQYKRYFIRDHLHKIVDESQFRQMDEIKIKSRFIMKKKIQRKKWRSDENQHIFGAAGKLCKKKLLRNNSSSWVKGICLKLPCFRWRMMYFNLNAVLLSHFLQSCHLQTDVAERTRQQPSNNSQKSVFCDKFAHSLFFAIFFLA